MNREQQEDTFAAQRKQNVGWANGKEKNKRRFFFFLFRKNADFFPLSSPKEDVYQMVRAMLWPIVCRLFYVGRFAHFSKKKKKKKKNKKKKKEKKKKKKKKRVTPTQLRGNEFLKRRGIQIDDLYKDLEDGLVLINLLEILSHPKTVPRHNKRPRIAVAKIENLAIVLQFIKEQGIVLVNIGAEDIHAGNSNIILGLIWTLILKYQISLGEDDSGKDHKNELLEWVRSKIGKNTPYG
jgi:hypothetical protein